MAAFRGTVRGQRGEASRLGSAQSGLRVNCNAWDIGVEAYASHDGCDLQGSDRITLYFNGGSNGQHGNHYLGYVHQHHETGEPEFIPSDWLREYIFNLVPRRLEGEDV